MNGLHLIQEPYTPAFSKNQSDFCLGLSLNLLEPYIRLYDWIR